MFGKIVEAKGPVVDVLFENELPAINDALTIDYSKEDNHGIEIHLTLEVALHIGKVRCIAMDSTDGLMRGMKVKCTGGPISVPVGQETLGRVFNVLGNSIDGKEELTNVEKHPIHRTEKI